MVLLYQAEDPDESIIGFIYKALPWPSRMMITQSHGYVLCH